MSSCVTCQEEPTHACQSWQISFQSYIARVLCVLYPFQFGKFSSVFTFKLQTSSILFWQKDWQGRNNNIPETRHWQFSPTHPYIYIRYLATWRWLPLILLARCDSGLTLVITLNLQSSGKTVKSTMCYSIACTHIRKSSSMVSRPQSLNFKGKSCRLEVSVCPTHMFIKLMETPFHLNDSVHFNSLWIKMKLLNNFLNLWIYRVINSHIYHTTSDQQNIMVSNSSLGISSWEANTWSQ